MPVEQNHSESDAAKQASKQVGISDCLRFIRQFRQDGVVHKAYAGDRQRSVEELRADLSHVLTGILHQRELEACVKTVRLSGQELAADRFTVTSKSRTTE
jgi:hypothetical protein